MILSENLLEQAMIMYAPCLMGISIDRHLWSLSLVLAAY